MERHFDVSLLKLKENLVSMAGLVEKAIETAKYAIETGKVSSLQNVFELEKKVNQSHIEIDGTCLKLLALQQPLAADLRLIVAIIKINTDLERMGDQAVNIALNAQRYLKQAPLGSLTDLSLMFSESQIMVREAIDSFVKTDEALARNVLSRDDQVDALKHKIFKDTLGLLKSPNTTTPGEPPIEQGLTLILIARNLERIGDHATNISEDVIFAITGEDIRHSPRVEIVKSALK
jgi:phosphate transport system protein